MRIRRRVSWAMLAGALTMASCQSVPRTTMDLGDLGKGERRVFRFDPPVPRASVTFEQGRSEVAFRGPATNSRTTVGGGSNNEAGLGISGGISEVEIVALEPLRNCRITTGP